MKSQRFTEYVWRNVRSSIILTWLMIVAVSVLAYTGFLIGLKSRQLHSSLKIAAETVNRSLQAGDWSLALGHLQSLERVGQAFEITLKSRAGGANIAGPFGTTPFGVGTICAAETVGVQENLSGCMHVLGSTEVYTLGYFLFFSLLVFLAALGFIQRKMRFFVKQVSDELKKISVLDSGTPTPGAASVVIDEVDAIRGHMLDLLKGIEKASASEAFANLSAQVAHDIRSPLAALDTVIKDISQLPEDNRIIVRSAVSRIHDIANDLIEKNRELAVVARKTDGAVFPAAAAEPKTCELLSSYLAPIITEKRLQFRSKIGITIESHFDAASYGLFADIQPAEFRRVLSNLINNGVEALPGRGAVAVSLTRNGDQAQLKVEDNGKGISKEVCGRLGQRGETHGKAGGSGLGLCHAKKSVEAWGGTFEITSAVGKGTAVLIRLPAAPPPAWFVSQLELPLDSPVVILDDDTTVHQIWEGRFDGRFVQEAGVEVIHFSKAEELKLWVRSNPDKAAGAVYLLDYELRGSAETGLTLAAELDLGARAILVTSRFEEKKILNECLRLKVRMIPKGLAGFVPVACPLSLRPDAILVDDDDLVHTVWKVAATTNGKTLGAFTTVREFQVIAGRLDKNTPIYLDSKLGEGVRGEEFAKELHSKGFRHLYIASGRCREQFPVMPWIKEVVGKEAPWK